MMPSTQHQELELGTIPFQLESSNSLHFDDVLFIPGLRNIFLPVLVMEDKGFVVEFKNQQVLIRYLAQIQLR
jgi:hypothetical protein